MQGRTRGIYRMGKRNSTDDITHSPIKYEFPACIRLIVAYNNEIWTSLKLDLQFYMNYLLDITTEVKGKWLHLK